MGEIDINALLADLERSRAARLRAWAVLGELRANAGEPPVARANSVERDADG